MYKAFCDQCKAEITGEVTDIRLSYYDEKQRKLKERIYHVCDKCKKDIVIKFKWDKKGGKNE